MSKDLSFHLISNDPRNKVTRCFTYYTKEKTKVSSFLKFQNQNILGKKVIFLTIEICSPIRNILLCTKSYFLLKHISLLKDVTGK